MRSLDQIQPQLQEYLCRLAESEVQVDSLEQVYGGASRQTWRIGLRQAAGKLPRRLVMRRTQPSALIETEQTVEAGAMQAFADKDLPIPRVYAVSPGGEELDAPFMLVGELPGAACSPFDVEPYAPHQQSIGEQFWRTLGAIAGDRDAAEAFTTFSAKPRPGDCWSRELDKWQAVLEEDSLGPEPIVSAALRWLRDAPPPPPEQLAAVHGDYRSGNFLQHRGQLTAVLDWEMAHIGDPLEDLAWALSPIWSMHAPDRPGGLIEREQAIQLWSEASGLTVDDSALHWWQVFAAIKGMAIWTSAGKEFISGSNEQPINLVSCWLCTDLDLQNLLHLLAPAGTQGAEAVI